MNHTPRITAGGAFRLLGLACLYAALQWAWLQARGTAVERALIHELTVGTAVSLINALTPEVRVWGAESSVRAAGGGINIRNGCEGTEIWFLLVAAMIGFRASWRVKLLGMLAGAVAVFALNQVRVIGLFYGLRHDRDLFDLLHTLIAPLFMVAGALVFFMLWAEWSGRRTPPGVATR